MLVLSRRQEETIVLNGNIEVTVLSVKGNTVRLGIKAPSNVKVLRGELAPFGKEPELMEVNVQLEDGFLFPTCSSISLDTSMTKVG